MEAYNRDEFQIWFIEFHARKESLGIAELTKYLDERLCKLNGQGISIAFWLQDVAEVAGELPANNWISS